MTAMLEVLVALPLPDALVERIAATDPRVTVRYAPDLLPPPRFPGDHAGDPGFRRDPAREARWSALAAGARVALGTGGSGPAALASLVRAAPRLDWVQGNTAGFGEQVAAAEPHAARLRQVRCTTAAGLHGPQLAEFTVMVLLSCTKDLARLHADRAAGRWVERPVRELAGQRVLVVGLGHVGRAVARACAALGMRVTGVRRHGGPATAPEHGPGGPLEHVTEVHPVSNLPELVPAADAVVLALPSTPQTAGLFGRDLIGAMRRDAVLVNVGRGATLDEAALVDALRAGRIGGAGLDVTAVEPLPPDSPLWSVPGLVLSPHTASVRHTESTDLVALFRDNLRRYLAGEPLRNTVGHHDDDRGDDHDDGRDNGHGDGGLNDSSKAGNAFR